MSSGSDILRNTFSMRTGVAHLRALPASSLLDLAFQKGGDDVFVTPLVHEIIHHACANTAVNVALQYRWLELLRLMISSPVLGVAIYDDEIEMAAKLAAAEAVFQPLAEGIAHFSEFDCVVPESRMGRDYMLGPADALMWRLIALKGTGGHMDQLFGQLKSEQLDARTIKRKTDVLCNPVRPRTGNDTYLLGYLIIKSLWNKFITSVKDARLRAPSFLNFVMYYIYEDWELARIIVTSGRESPEPIIERIVARLKKLFDSDLVSQVIAFTDDMANRSNQRGTLIRGPEERKHGGFQGLGINEAEIKQAMLALINFQQEYVAAGARLAPQQKIENLTNLQHLNLMREMDASQPFVRELLYRQRLTGDRIVRLLDFVLDLPQQKRAFCYLMDIPVAIRAQNGTELLLSPLDDPSRVRSMPAPSASAFSDVAQPGRLFGVIASTAIPWRFYCFVLHQDRVVAVWGHGAGDDDAEFQQLSRTITTEVQMENATRLSFVKLNEFMMSNQQIQEVVGERADAASQAIAEELNSILQTKGWAGLLTKQTKFDFGVANIVPKKSVKSLAAAGICNAFSRDRQEMESLMHEAGYKLSDVLEVSEQVKKETGVTLSRAANQHLYIQI
jgi:hypothetical protein